MASILVKLGCQFCPVANGTEVPQVWKELREHVQMVCADAVMPGGMIGTEIFVPLRQLDSVLF